MEVRKARSIFGNNLLQNGNNARFRGVYTSTVVRNGMRQSPGPLNRRICDGGGEVP
jgi:hypothetical protein